MKRKLVSIAAALAALVIAAAPVWAAGEAKASRLEEYKARNKGLLGPGVAEGKPAPDFTLAALNPAGLKLEGMDGAERVQLSKLVGKKPIVLLFGSYSSAPFRDWIIEIEQLYAAYKDQAHFLFIYSKEAHPDDAKSVPAGEKAMKDAKTAEERREAAERCGKALKIQIPTLIDDPENSAAKAYHGLPIRLYVLDAQGNIAFRGASGGDKGPFGFSSMDAEAKLLSLLGKPADAKVLKTSKADAKWNLKGK